MRRRCRRDFHSALRIVVACVFLSCLFVLSRNNEARAQAGANEFGSHYESRVSGRPRVIVFVHGIYGDARSTWTAPNGAYFPALVAQDSSITQSNVFVAGYETKFFGQNHSIKQLGTDLFKELSTANVFADHKEVVFVCHSLGGLVIETLLIDHPEVTGQVAYLHFYGTPHQGSILASFRATFGRDPLISELKAGDGNAYLVQLDKDWRKAGYTIHRFCVAEGVGMAARAGIAVGSLPDFVVPYYSATYRCDTSVPADMIPADHLGIVKPADRTHPAYRIFKRIYRENPVVRVQQTVRNASTNELQVDCNHTNSSLDFPISVQLDPLLKERVLAVTAELLNTANIKDVTGPTILRVEDNTAHLSYGFNGLDKGTFGCPGGGHATLVAHFTVEQHMPIPDGVESN
jgi:pimeloyl-ACP methyl ester carboxylesterase